LEWGIQNLKAFAKQPTNKVTTESRIRALSILARIAKLPNLERNVLDSELIETQLRMHLYLQDLEKLQMNQSPKEFDQCDKHALARSIWLTKRTEKIALRLICKLALDFDFDDYQLWNNVLSALYEKQDLDYLFSVLLHLESSTRYSNLESIRELLQPVVLGCSKRWFSVNLEVDIDQIQHFFRYLQVGTTSCYVDETFGREIWELTKNWMFQRPFHPSRYIIGYYCQYRVLSDCELHEYFELYNPLNSEQILRILDCMKVMTSKAVALAEIKSKFERSIFDWLNKNSLYTHIVSTQYMTAFVKHLAISDTIHDLVNATVELKRYEDALKLLEVYFKFHPVDGELTETELIDQFQANHPTFNATPLLDYLALQDE
jgi:hypothetical protein